MPRFIDPTTDFAFKKLFANESKKEIVISFLNSILDRSEGEKIVDVVINDPHNTGSSPLSKFSIVDIYCTDQKKRHYIIEMQVAYQDSYRERSQYYVSAATMKQLGKGEDYGKLCPIIFIGVLDFKALKTPDYLSYFSCYNKKYEADELPLHHYYFIELPKFTKQLHELESLVDKWIFFLKHATECRTIPSELQNEAALETAFSVLQESLLSPEELLVYEKNIDDRRVELDVLASHKKLGLEEGLKKGRAEGINQGRTEERRLLAKNFLQLGVLSIEQIAQASGLTVDEIRAIERQLKTGK